MPKNLRYEVFIESTDKFKEQTGGNTPTLYQGSPANLDFAFFDADGALIDLGDYTDITLEVWEDQDDGARILQQTLAAASFDLTCLLADWTAKTKQPARFVLTGTELNFTIAAGKTEATFYIVIGGTPVVGEPETLGYSTLKMLKDRFGEPGDTVENDPATYLTVEQSDARYARRYTAIVDLTGGGSGKLDGIVTAGGATPLRTLVPIVLSGALSWWQLQIGTTAEDTAAGIVHPNDHDGATNAVIWVRVA